MGREQWVSLVSLVRYCEQTVIVGRLRQCACCWPWTAGCDISQLLHNKNPPTADLTVAYEIFMFFIMHTSVKTFTTVHNLRHILMSVSKQTPKNKNHCWIAQIYKMPFIKTWGRSTVFDFIEGSQLDGWLFSGMCWYNTDYIVVSGYSLAADGCPP